VAVSIARSVRYIIFSLTVRAGNGLALCLIARFGAYQTPPLWMKPDDTIEVEISGIGVLRNPIIAEE
jgi:2-keto-4-pentenoate hydratase/2-oxohepta-3-ene-1,7-dioic acid hydratase in catechol pathway